MKHIFLLFLFLHIAFLNKVQAADNLLNVSYEATRQLYSDLNLKFQSYYKDKYGKDISVAQSHGPSANQARGVIEGMQASVVTLALHGDIDEISKQGLINPKWRDNFPNKSAPFSSVVVFMVRRGNPKNVHNWDDLIKPNVSIITSNPRTSGVGKLAYLTAWEYASRQTNYNDDNSLEFMYKLFKNIPSLDVGSRSSAMRFFRRNIGDVLITWESEAHLALQEYNRDGAEIVIPATTLRVDLPVAMVDKIVEAHSNKELAIEYLNFLYTPLARQIGAINYFRNFAEEPDPLLLKKIDEQKITVMTLDDLGESANIYRKHFAKDGYLEKVFQNFRKNKK